MWKRLLLSTTLVSVIGCSADHETLGLTRSDGIGGSGGTGGSGGSGAILGSGGDGFDVPVRGTGGAGYCVVMQFGVGEGGAGDAGMPDAALADVAPSDGAATAGRSHDGGSADASDARAAVDAGAYPDIPRRCRWDLGNTLPLNVDFQTARVELGGRDGQPVTPIPWITACSVDGGADGFTYDDCKDPHVLVLCSTACDRLTSENPTPTLYLWCPPRPNPW